MTRFIPAFVLVLSGCVIDVSDELDDVQLEEHVDAITTSTLLRTQIPCTKTQYPILRATHAMTAGVPYSLAAPYAATNHYSGPVMQGEQLRCTRAADGVVEWRSVWTTRNHEGAAYGTRVITVRDLFVPATTGTYTCEVLAHAAQTNCDSTRYLTVQAGASTYLTVSQASAGTARWEDAANVRVAPASSAYVMRQSWWAAPSAVRINVNSDVETTDMTDSSTAYCGAMGSPTSTATVTTTLYATQVDAAGLPCRAAATDTRTLAVTPTIHHAKLYNSLRDVPICKSSACAYAGKVCTNRFAIKTLVHATGNPICVHLPRYSNSIAFNE